MPLITILYFSFSNNHYFWVLLTIYILVNFVKKQSVVYIKKRKEIFRNEKDSITSSWRECME